MDSHPASGHGAPFAGALRAAGAGLGSPRGLGALASAGQLAAIARATFLGAVRQPVYIVLVLGGIAALALSAAISVFALGDEERLLLDLGLSTVLTTGLVLGALLASATLGRDLADRTALASLAAPLTRARFLVGTFAGLAAALALAGWIWSGALWLVLAHGVVREGGSVDGVAALLGGGAVLVALVGGAIASYVGRRAFAGACAWLLAIALPLACGVDHLVHRGEAGRLPFDAMQLAVTLALLVQAVWVLTAVGIAAATRLGPGATLLACFAALVLGLAREPLLREVAERPVWVAHGAADELVTDLASAAAGPASGAPALAPGWPQVLAVRALRVVVPDLQGFAVGEALHDDVPVSARYVGWQSAYAALAVGAWLALAALSFEARDAG